MTYELPRDDELPKDDIFNPSNWPGEDGVYHKPQRKSNDQCREMFEKWHLAAYPRVSLKRHNDYYWSDVTQNRWIGWNACYVQRAEAILAGFKTEGGRTKVDEWETCYAMLFKQLNSLPKPVVSLEKCAKALDCNAFACMGEENERPADKQRRARAFKQAKAVLDAAEVRYVD